MPSGTASGSEPVQRTSQHESWWEFLNDADKTLLGNDYNKTISLESIVMPKSITQDMSDEEVDTQFSQAVIARQALQQFTNIIDTLKRAARYVYDKKDPSTDDMMPKLASAQMLLFRQEKIQLADQMYDALDQFVDSIQLPFLADLCKGSGKSIRAKTEKILVEFEKIIQPSRAFQSPSQA